MNKVLVFLRVSTEAQELDEQKKEMIDFVYQYGYKQKDIIFVEDKGASAIKLNEKYNNMISTMENYIDEGKINCVAVWAVNRLARNEVVYAKVKEKLVKNKVNLLVKNPTLSLLNPDGSVNTGNELALSLFAVMGQQDMAEKQERFKRTKRALSKQNKWVGGNTIKFGYTIDENRYFIPKEDEANVIKLIFNLFGKDVKSSNYINKELISRGINIGRARVLQILKDKSYCGRENKNGRYYPAIVSQELFDKCQEIKKKHAKFTRKRGNILASRLIK